MASNMLPSIQLATDSLGIGQWAKPAELLIEKTASFVGATASFVADAAKMSPEERRARADVRAAVIRAEGEARTGLIQANQDAAIEAVQQRAVARLGWEETRKQLNMEDIALQALPLVTEDAKPEDIEDDWVAHFFDNCRNTSDEDMQKLWAKLLAGEANKPGSFSKRTLSILADMSKEDAENFRNVCRFVWFEGSDIVPMIHDWKKGICTEVGIDYKVLTHLTSMGLLQFECDENFITDHTTSPTYYQNAASGETLQCVFEGPKVTLRVGCTDFTQAGRELLALCAELPPVPGLTEYVKSKLRANKLIRWEGNVGTVGGEHKDG